jgi:hypothetical protein
MGLSKSDAGAPAILVDELDVGSFESAPDHVEGRATWLADSHDANSGMVGCGHPLIRPDSHERIVAIISAGGVSGNGHPILLHFRE